MAIGDKVVEVGSGVLGVIIDIEDWGFFPFVVQIAEKRCHFNGREIQPLLPY